MTALANWVKETTATTGTGPIDLAGAETGFIAVTDGFSDGDMVEYFITSGNNREHGMGAFTASGTTLARTYIFETLFSGTYNNTNPTAISLTGTSTVICAASSRNVLSSGGLIYSIVDAGDMNVPDNVTGASYATSNTIGTANLACGLYFSISMPIRITNICFDVSTADAACTHLRWAIYNLRDDGDPGKVLLDTGDLSSEVATGGKKNPALANSIDLPAGVYMYFTVSDSTTLAIDGASQTAGWAGPGSVNRDAVNRFRPRQITGVTGAFAADPTTADSSTFPYGLGWK